ncbi:MAG: AMP-binding protein [Acidobacteria bacterium]|nr:MAG: AMP-binding protein [Acidobacteria bacterium 13_1_40CM_2_56_11]PYS15944.1 MAG: AMP-binding protein [Acidobacteriota bacterium]
MSSEEPKIQPSYASGTGSTPLLGCTIGDALDTTARAYSNSPALVSRHQNQRLTFAELSAAVERFALGLMHLAVQKGDRVGIWATNCSEWVIVQFAAAKIGAILVNVNPAYRAYELKFALEQSGCQTLIMVPNFKNADFVSIFFETCPEAKAAKAGTLSAADLPFLKNLILIDKTHPDSFFGWNQILAMGDHVAFAELRQREAGLAFDEPINIQYTSGTTGHPKGAVLSHHNIVNNALLVAECMRIAPGDRICVPVPFYHCFGMVMGNMAAVLKASTIVIPAPHFDALRTLEAVAEERCTALYGVPTMFRAELEHPEFDRFDLRSLRTGIMAGSPCPIQLMKRVVAEMHCPEITIAYGQTESSPVITQTTTDDPIELRVTTVGRALPHTEIKIIDPATGKIVPRGTQGELCTRGYCVMKGYYNNDQATRAAVDPDGWLHTGDIAVMREDGYCRIAGRVKDMIIRGGENIYPREIEEFLYTCPGISEVQIVGIPSAKYGEEVAAWVKLQPGAALSAEEIRAFCSGKIASFKIPRYVKMVNEFPMTVTGKIQKFRMREIMIHELGLDETDRIETA